MLVSVECSRLCNLHSPFTDVVSQPPSELVVILSPCTDEELKLRASASNSEVLLLTSLWDGRKPKPGDQEVQTRE